MNVWIRRFRSMFTAPPVVLPTVINVPVPRAALGVHVGPVRVSAPPITDLDLLRALGCDV
ncbi:hypothetical protein ACFP9V_04445 [Deinococcus radiopugnans]|uniref:Uncharacterized protein n=1 Tax=Deinococcus radiopugnans ATCC 19172 TaxID=585398 RepID=A0A5C4YBN3_9DEIO|nr:hypothetical protein [Deinococcus radiopugnans]MBB6015779.1 hypothetical protein [Deinococcus radiopugnans ATCC 19172]TNM72539.1 hypothetical protein FHR04_01505 [Deinococcus radiopugnans ATCC 19172]